MYDEDARSWDEADVGDEDVQVGVEERGLPFIREEVDREPETPGRETEQNQQRQHEQQYQQPQQKNMYSNATPENATRGELLRECEIQEEQGGVAAVLLGFWVYLLARMV